MTYVRSVVTRSYWQLRQYTVHCTISSRIPPVRSFHRIQNGILSPSSLVNQRGVRGTWSRSAGTTFPYRKQCETNQGQIGSDLFNELRNNASKRHGDVNDAIQIPTPVGLFGGLFCYTKRRRATRHHAILNLVVTGGGGQSCSVLWQCSLSNKESVGSFTQNYWQWRWNRPWILSYCSSE